MGFLIIAIMCSSSIGLTFAYAKSKEMSTLHVTFFNYLTAFGCSGFILVRQLAASANPSNMFAGQASLVFFALYTGMVYLAAFLGIQFSVLKNGPSITTMFNRLGMVIPVAVSIVLFNEVPTTLRWAGIILAVLSLVTYSYNKGFQFNGLLFMVFMLGGTAELSNKLFSALFDESLKGCYLLIVFGTCVVLTAFILKYQKQKSVLTKQEVQTGIFLGVANFSTAFFILKALTSLPSTIVYPSLSVGIILVTALMSKLFFDEVFTRKTCFVLGLTVVSLVLINL